MGPRKTNFLQAAPSSNASPVGPDDSRKGKEIEVERKQPAGSVVLVDGGDRTKRQELVSGSDAGDKSGAAVGGGTEDIASIGHGNQDACDGVEGTLEGDQGEIVAKLVSKREHEGEVRQVLEKQSLGARQQPLVAGILFL